MMFPCSLLAARHKPITNISEKIPEYDLKKYSFEKSNFAGQMFIVRAGEIGIIASVEFQKYQVVSFNF